MRISSTAQRRNAPEELVLDEPSGELFLLHTHQIQIQLCGGIGWLLEFGTIAACGFNDREVSIVYIASDIIAVKAGTI
jgi:hypothetical protein